MRITFVWVPTPTCLPAMSLPVPIAQLITPPASPTSTPKAPGAPRKPRNRSLSELSPPPALLGRVTFGYLNIPPFNLDDDSVDEDVNAGVNALKVSDRERPEEVPSGKVLYDQEDETLHGCAMYAAKNSEDGTVVLAMDFHGELNVTSIGNMSSLEMAKKVARLLVEEHHAAHGEHPSCTFFTDPNANARYLVAGICPRGDEDT